MHKILVVEDNREISDPLIKLLEANHFETFHCEKGEMVVKMIETYNPDLLLLEQALPYRSGLEVCKDVRINSDIPIIIMSAKNDNSEYLKAYLAGVNDYINKPFQMSYLVSRIERLLSSNNTVN